MSHNHVPGAEHQIPGNQTTERPVTRLPEFPRPDLPGSHPANYDTLRVRVMRRMNLPDDGGMWIHDAIDTRILEGYNARITNDNAKFIFIAFASLADATSWAEMITTIGHDREMISFVAPPKTPYAPVIIQITL